MDSEFRIRQCQPRLRTSGIAEFHNSTTVEIRNFDAAISPASATLFWTGITGAAAPVSRTGNSPSTTDGQAFTELDEI